jgi:hypothetical protein
MCAHAAEDVTLQDVQSVKASPMEERQWFCRRSVRVRKRGTRKVMESSSMEQTITETAIEGEGEADSTSRDIRALLELLILLYYSSLIPFLLFQLIVCSV